MTADAFRQATGRGVIAAAWLALAACPAIAGAGKTDPPLYGRAVAFAQAGSPHDRLWQDFKTRAAADTSIRIDYFIRGERGGEEQMMHDLRRGRVHIGAISLQGLSSTIPELTIPMIPFLFESEAEVDFVYDEYLLDLFNDIAAEKGLVFLMWAAVGWNNIYSRVPILTPEDARGRRLRGSPNAAAQSFLKAINADAIPLGSTDLVPALQTGLIDGGITSTLFHFYVTRKYADHFTLTRHTYDMGAMVVNRAWFEKATAAQRGTIRSAWGKPVEARALVRRVAAEALRTMREEGISVHELTPAQRARWIEATKGVDERLVTSVGGRAREVFEAVRKGKRAFRARSVSEAASGAPPGRP